MNSIPILLLDNFKRSSRNTCFLMKLVSRRDESLFTFTNLNAAVKFDDGIHDAWYMPRNSLQPQNIQMSADMDADNTELVGWFDDVTMQAADAGVLDGAEITIYRINYQNTSLGAEIVGFGVAGRMSYAPRKEGTRKIEFRGLDHLLKIKKNPLYSITCRNDFGDERCGKEFVWDVGEVESVANQNFWVKVSSVAAAAAYYNFGVVRFTSGLNAGVEMEVEEWGDDGWMRLSFATPYPMQAGDELMIRQDCDKLAATCIAYGNIINFSGEHLTPVQDQSLMVPGAYIKTNNAL